VLFERVPRLGTQALDDLFDRETVDIQLESEPGKDDVQLVIADGCDTRNSPRNATLAATALETIYQEYDTLVVRRTSFDVVIVAVVLGVT
jgi:hypothetical protein